LALVVATLATGTLIVADISFAFAGEKSRLPDAPENVPKKRVKPICSTLNTTCVCAGSTV
jgi:hypothetical protein